MDKRAFLSLVVLLVAVAASAQVQYGYVKTKGTLSKRGERLNGVTVSVRGGSNVVTAGKGEFSFTVPSKNFSFSKVTKSGYILTDKDFLNRNFVYSSEWKVIVMEKPEQRAKEVKIIKEKVNKTLEADIKKKEAEIARLEKEGKKSAAEIRKLKKQLYDAIDANEKLVEEMTERYVSIDYDQMDDVNRQATELILNGELEKAKRLLDNQGSIDDNINDVNLKREELQKAIENSAERFIKYYDICLLKHQNDSAAYYLEKRVELDPTNVQWLLEAGNFYRDYLAKYKKTKNLYDIAFLQSLKNGESNPNVADCYHQIGVLLEIQGKYLDALENANKSLKIRNEIYGEFHPDVVKCFINIGVIYGELGNYVDALKCFMKALDISKEVNDVPPTDVAKCYNNIGNVFDFQGEFASALEYHYKSLAIRKEVYGDLHPDVAMSWHNIGVVYENQGYYSDAMFCYKKSLSIYEDVYGKMHPTVARSLNSIGLLLNDQGLCAEAMNCCLKSLSIYMNVCGDFHPAVAFCYNNIGTILLNLRKFDDALEYYNKSLEIRREVYGDFKSEVADCYNNIGMVLLKQGKYTDSLDFFNKAFVVYVETVGIDHPSTIRTMRNLNIVKDMISSK